MSRTFDLRLEPEQIEALKTLVEAHRRVPRELRGSFIVVTTNSGTSVVHHGLPGWHYQVAHSDLEVLAHVDLLYGQTERGRITHLTVLPDALAYYEALSHEADARFDPAGNEPFTEREIALLDEGIARVRAYISAANVDAAAIVGIEQRLDYLGDSVRRLGRFDWRIIAWSVTWEIAVAASFAPERARELLDLLVSGARGLLGA